MIPPVRASFEPPVKVVQLWWSDKSPEVIRGEPVIRQRSNGLIRLVIIEPREGAVSWGPGAFARASESYHQRVFFCLGFFIVER